MPDDIRDILVEIIDSYGIKILEDPDRLAQFLEDRSSLRPEGHLPPDLRAALSAEVRLAALAPRIYEGGRGLSRVARIAARLYERSRPPRS